MADLSDVETALVALVTTALYTKGLASPSAVGTDCRIYRGWPTPAGLDADLRAGLVNITIFPDAAPGQAMTRYTSDWHGVPVAPTLSGSVAGNTVTFSGAAASGQLAGIRLTGHTFTYRTVDGDTPALVAAKLATMIRAGQLVHLAGSSLTIPGVANIVVRVVADSPALREIRRQSHDIRISFWCPTPTLRDSACTIVDTNLADITFLELPDTSVGRITYKATSAFDRSQSAILYRRDLIYSVEYPTILSVSLAAMVFGEIALGATNVSA